MKVDDKSMTEWKICGATAKENMLKFLNGISTNYFETRMKQQCKINKHLVVTNMDDPKKESSKYTIIEAKLDKVKEYVVY